MYIHKCHLYIYMYVSMYIYISIMVAMQNIIQFCIQKSNTIKTIMTHVK